MTRVPVNYMDTVGEGPLSIIPCIMIPSRINSDELMLPQHSFVFISERYESREAWEGQHGNGTRVCNTKLCQMERWPMSLQALYVRNSG